VGKLRDALSNAQLAELLAVEAERSPPILQRAFRRAARNAFLWPEEAVDLLRNDRPLTELRGVGPFIEKQLRTWIKKPPSGRTIPAIRRDFLSLAQATKTLAAKPEWKNRLCGDLQMHTQWSDGSASIEEMAAAGADRKYRYVAITDHSKGLKIAGGLNEAKLTQQGREIDRLNKFSHSDGNALVVLRSIEMNLSPQGEGDMAVDSLRKLDLVLGSFHSKLRTPEDQTGRYLAALRNRNIQILAHPRGRIYNFRIGLRADWPRVLAEAARLNKAVEIDCYPDRQDLNVSLLKLARKEGCRISLGTDAHHPWQLSFIDLGLAAAFKAKISSDRILNFMPLTELKRWVDRVRSRTS